MKRIAITVLGMIMTVVTFGQYQEINNGESGLSVRTKLNNMHSELYEHLFITQFSSDASSWHDDLNASDKYFKISTDFGANYSDPIYFFNGIDIIDSLQMNSNKISGLSAGVNLTDAVNVQQLIDTVATATGISGTDPALVQSDTTDLVATQYFVENYAGGKSVYQIALANAGSVQERVNGATYIPTGWSLSSGLNTIDLSVEHGLNRRVANVNVCTVSGTTEQVLRPYSTAYSGWETTDENTLIIKALATTPLPLKIYIIFE